MEIAKRLETTNNSFNSIKDSNKETEVEKQNYINEMKKRDDIIMILCKKVQGMES
jgi:hypothetical protein